MVSTDFPFTIVSSSDYKKLSQVGRTFGNDKIVSGKNFRPSYALSLTPQTILVTIPVKLLDEAVKRLANTGENKEKTDFFIHYPWFANFTQSLKTKFNNCVQKKTFYPGAKIICEGANSMTVYAIVEGTCNLVCKQTASRFTVLEYEADPTKARRDSEHNY